MEGERFDQVARLLGGSGSRRRALGALLGGALGLAGLSAEAKKGKDAKRGGKGKGRSDDRGRITTAAIPAGGCPTPGGSVFQICHCADNSTCERRQSNESGHTTHVVDCCCSDPGCSCQTGTGNCCKQEGQLCRRDDHCCNPRFCVSRVNGTGRCCLAGQVWTGTACCTPNSDATTCAG